MVKTFAALAALMMLSTGALAQAPKAGTHRLPALPALPTVPMPHKAKTSHEILAVTAIRDPKTGRPTGQVIQHGGSAGKKGRVLQAHDPGITMVGKADKPSNKAVNMYIGKDKKGRPVTVTHVLENGSPTGYVQEHRGKPGEAPTTYALGRRDPKTGKKTPIKTLH